MKSAYYVWHGFYQNPPNHCWQSEHHFFGLLLLITISTRSKALVSLPYRIFQRGRKLPIRHNPAEPARSRTLFKRAASPSKSHGAKGDNDNELWY